MQEYKYIGQLGHQVGMEIIKEMFYTLFLNGYTFAGAVGLVSGATDTTHKTEVAVVGVEGNKVRLRLWFSGNDNASWTWGYMIMFIKNNSSLGYIKNQNGELQNS